MRLQPVAGVLGGGRVPRVGSGQVSLLAVRAAPADDLREFQDDGCQLARRLLLAVQHAADDVGCRARLPAAGVKHPAKLREGTGELPSIQTI